MHLLQQNFQNTTIFRVFYDKSFQGLQVWLTWGAGCRLIYTRSSATRNTGTRPSLALKCIQSKFEQLSENMFQNKMLKLSGRDGSQ